MITPLGNTVLLAPLAPPRLSPGGILYLNNAPEERMQWRVLAVGPGKKLPDGTWLPPEVRVGDKCLFDGNTLHKYRFDDGRALVDADQIQMVWQ